MGQILNGQNIVTTHYSKHLNINTTNRKESKEKKQQLF